MGEETKNIERAMKKYLTKGIKGMYSAAKSTVNYATGKSNAGKNPTEESKAAAEEAKQSDP